MHNQVTLEELIQFTHPSANEKEVFQTALLKALIEFSIYTAPSITALLTFQVQDSDEKAERMTVSYNQYDFLLPKSTNLELKIISKIAKNKSITPIEEVNKFSLGIFNKLKKVLEAEKSRSDADATLKKYELKLQNLPEENTVAVDTFSKEISSDSLDQSEFFCSIIKSIRDFIKINSVTHSTTNYAETIYALVDFKQIEIDPLYTAITQAYSNAMSISDIFGENRKNIFSSKNQIYIDSLTDPLFLACCSGYKASALMKTIIDTLQPFVQGGVYHNKLAEYSNKILKESICLPLIDQDQLAQKKDYRAYVVTPKNTDPESAAYVAFKQHFPELEVELNTIAKNSHTSIKFFLGRVSVPLRFLSDNSDVFAAIKKKIEEELPPNVKLGKIISDLKINTWTIELQNKLCRNFSAETATKPVQSKVNTLQKKVDENLKDLLVTKETLVKFALGQLEKLKFDNYAGSLDSNLHEMYAQQLMSYQRKDSELNSRMQAKDKEIDRITKEKEIEVTKKNQEIYELHTKLRSLIDESLSTHNSLDLLKKNLGEILAIPAVLTILKNEKPQLVEKLDDIKRKYDPANIADNDESDDDSIYQSPTKR